MFDVTLVEKITYIDTNLRPQGSLSAILRTSWAIRRSKSGGSSTSPQDSCARLAARSSSSSRWCKALKALVSDSMSSSFKIPVIHKKKHWSIGRSSKKKKIGASFKLNEKKKIKIINGEQNKVKYREWNGRDTMVVCNTEARLPFFSQFYRHVSFSLWLSCGK